MVMRVPGAVNAALNTAKFPEFDDLLGLWLFNESPGAGTAVDHTGNNDATVGGGDFVAGFVGNGFQYDGGTSMSLPSGYNILGITGGEFGHFVAFYYPGSGRGTQNTCALNVTVGATNPENSGLLFRVEDNGQIVYRIKTQDSSGFGGGSRGLWNSNVFCTVGWNVIAMNKYETYAEALRISAAGEASNTFTLTTSSFNFSTGGNPVNQLIGRDGSDQIQDISGVKNSPISIEDLRIIWNNGNGVEP